MSDEQFLQPWKRLDEKRKKRFHEFDADLFRVVRSQPPPIDLGSDHDTSSSPEIANIQLRIFLSTHSSFRPLYPRLSYDTSWHWSSLKCRRGYSSQSSVTWVPNVLSSLFPSQSPDRIFTRPLFQRKEGHRCLLHSPTQLTVLSV